MNWKKEKNKLIIIVSVFLACFYIPLGNSQFENALMNSLHLLKWYAREHVVLCLVPAFFVAGAIAVFINQASVMKYLGAGANKILAYSVASVSGSILAVCSCTVLPLFSGIYKMGAGLGPAVTFLYSGPAINIMAILLTARVLGLELSIARSVGAIIFSIIIGLLMQLIFRKEELEKQKAQIIQPSPKTDRPLWKNLVYFSTMVGILIFATWGKPLDAGGIWSLIYSFKWVLTSLFSLALGILLILWFGVKWWKILFSIILITPLTFLFESPLISFSAGIVALSIITSRESGECGDWFESSWTFSKQILPLLFFWSIVCRVFLWSTGWGWFNSFQLGYKIGWRKWIVSKLFCFYCWCIHVLCNVNRNPYSAGFNK